MAGAWDAKVEISTADATLNLRNLKTEAAGLAAALRALDTELAAGQKNIQAVAASFTELVVAQRAAIAAQKEQAAGSVAQARADAITIANNNKIAESEAKVGLLNERQNTVKEQGAAITQKMSAVDEAASLKRDQAAQKDIANEEKKAVASAKSADAAAKAARADNSDLTLSDNLSNSRYLLYDVGATYGVMSAALLAIPAATAAVAASYQKDFAQVLRVTDQSGASAEGLRQNLKDLATQIPVTFAELANITQIGAQMGIATDKLGAFTETTAKFTAVTGVATETAATLFGRLQNMFPDEAKSSTFFNSIGSAIAKVGADTVATDPQIAAMSVQIAAVGASAGFTAAQTIGLSAALASVAVQPELARGTLTRVFGKLNMDVATGSDKMNAFAGVLKMTSAQASSLWQSDPSQFFTKLVSGLHDIQTAQGGVGLTQTLSQLGVTSVRDVSTLTRLAVGYDTLALSMTSADNAAASGTALDQMSKPVFETLAAKLTMLGSAFKNLFDTLGSNSLGPISALVDGIKNMVTGFDDLIKTVPGFQAVIGVVGVIVAITGAFLGLKAAQAFALAGLVGFQQVAGKSGLSSAMSLKGVLEQLVKTWLMAGGASTDAATQMLASSGIIKSAALAASGGAATLNTATEGVAVKSVGAVGALKGLGTALYGLAGGGIGVAVLAAGGLVTAMVDIATHAQAAADDVAKAYATSEDAGIKALASQLQSKPKNVFGLETGTTIQDQAKSIGVSFDLLLKAASGAAGSTDELKKALNDFAVSKGYKSYTDLMSKQNAKPGANTDAANIKAVIDSTKLYGDTITAQEQKTKDAADAQAKLGDATTNTIDPITGQTKAQTDSAAATKAADDAVKSYIDDIFSLMDASMATNDSLEKLGGSLQKSTSLSINDANGRDNLKNLQDAMKNAALEQQQLVDSGQESYQQAATNYSAFIDGLMKKLTSMGVDTSQIQGLVQQATGAFDAGIQKAAPAALAVKVDTAKVKEATDYLDSVVKTYGTRNLDMLAKITGTDQVGSNVYAMQQYIESATGKPYVATVTADTTAANKNTEKMVTYTDVLFGIPFTATIDANTDPGTQALQAFGQYAASVMNTIIDGINSVNNFGGDLLGHKSSDLLGHVGWGAPAPAHVAPTVNARPDIPAPPAQVSADSPSAGADATAKSLDALGNGYDNAAKAAAGAGAAGAKAGQDMAKGIDAATAAVNDYASRLQTSLTSVYDKQYGMQIATDNYQKALNAIVDKRAADLKSIQDLIDKQKQLNDAMGTDLVDANKAKIEQAISIKYGEGARAADYGNKAQTALDNAAAKKKEMDADAASQKVLQDGLGDLTSNTNAAIANRDAVRGLETQMLAMVDAYAKTGASQQQVTAYAQSLSQKFQGQVVQVGYTQSAVQNLTGDMGRYVAAVARVPYRVATTVNANTGAAQNAVNGLANSLNNLPNRTVTVTLVGASLWKTPNITSDGQPIYDVLNNGHRNGTQLFNEGGQVQGFADGGQIPGTPPSNPRADNLMAKVDGQGMIRVRSKEFIQPQEAVNYYGLDFMNAIRTMSLPKFNMGGQVGGASSGGGRGGAGVQVVELTASNIAAIARMADQPVNLYTNDEIIATSAARGNTTLASKGFN